MCSHTVMVASSSQNRSSSASSTASRFRVSNRRARPSRQTSRRSLPRPDNRRNCGGCARFSSVTVAASASSFVSPVNWFSFSTSCTTNSSCWSFNTTNWYALLARGLSSTSGATWSTSWTGRSLMRTGSWNSTTTCCKRNWPWGVRCTTPFSSVATPPVVRSRKASGTLLVSRNVVSNRTRPTLTEPSSKPNARSFPPTVEETAVMV